MNSARRKLLDALARLSPQECGASVLEWAVLASCIVAVAVVGITNVGQKVAGLFGWAADVIGAVL